jgi:hypothetical protein
MAGVRDCLPLPLLDALCCEYVRGFNNPLQYHVVANLMRKNTLVVCVFNAAISVGTWKVSS